LPRTSQAPPTPLAIPTSNGPGPVAAALPTLSLRVVPEDVNLSLGHEALVQIVARNGGASPWTPALRFELPAGVSAVPAFAPGEIAPGATLEIPLVLRESGATPGDYKSSVLGGTVAAPFRLHVTDAPPPAAAAQQARAPEPVGGGALPAVAVAGAGAAALGGGVLSFFALRKRWPLLAAALYTRLAPNKVLDQPTREKLATLVHDEPGISFNDAAKRLGLGAGTLTYHAHVLERSGIVFSARDGQQRRFFPVSGGRVAGVASLGDRALAALSAGPRGLAELARELGVSRQALHYHLKRLAREGKVRAQGAGRDLTFAQA